MKKHLIKLMLSLTILVSCFSLSATTFAVEPSEIIPAYQATQVLLDADLLGTKKYCAFPTMLKLSETDVLIYQYCYKQELVKSKNFCK